MNFKGVSLSNPIYDKIDILIKNSYPNSCILYIDEICNNELLDKYNNRKDELLIKRNGNIRELQLFHGTKHSNINSIAKNGFRSESNQRSVYGIGTYFSTQANYSKDYSDRDTEDISYMFVCNVLIGNCTVMSCNSTINTELFDNSVNKIENPNIYVTPYNDGCIPKYLVAFYKNAK